MHITSLACYIPHTSCCVIPQALSEKLSAISTDYLDEALAQLQQHPVPAPAREAGSGERDDRGSYARDGRRHRSKGRRPLTSHQPLSDESDEDRDVTDRRGGRGSSRDRRDDRRGGRGRGRGRGEDGRLRLNSDSSDE